ncbi:MAG: rod shape-determining protein MreC [Candidatus Liptonbacteria bacterium]
MKEQWMFIALIAICLLVTVFYPSLGWLIRDSLYMNTAANVSDEELLRSNQALLAQVAVLTSAQKEVPNKNDAYVSAFVYSRYPFNYKNEVLVSAGGADGVHEGDLAVVPIASAAMSEQANDNGTFRGVLLGKVRQVFNDSALVETVYDKDFESAVRIGAEGIDSLLKGGTTPRLTLIPPRANVKQGDIAYTASSNGPYGIPVGSVDKISMATDKVFDEATLNMGYDVNRITIVYLIKTSGTR